ncbi:AMP-binding protein [Streptomyces mordarskii]|uniref:ATP-dependent acyl-CoA ligase n=1 Tax=Streptomyces mordarskii TaxID=1226758 RepID=A0ABP3NXY3_9ACTN
MNCAPDSATPTTATLVSRWAVDPRAIFAVVLDEQGCARTISYAEQLDRLRRTAAALRAAGVRRGDRVHLQIANRPEFYDVWFASALLGATLVPTGPQSTVDELRHVLADAAPVVSIVLSDQVSVVHEAAAGLSALSVLAVDGDAPASLKLLTAGIDPGAAPDESPPGPTDVAAILYTSGTTSRPKGVLITHANYLAVGRTVTEHLSITTADRWLITLPLFHANAQYYCTMSALVSGASIVLAPRFSASAWGRQAAEHGATLGSLFAAPIRMILARSEDRTDPRHRLRAVLFAQNLTDDQAARFERQFNTRLLQLYGMTETVLPPTLNPDSPQRRWHSIGQALHGVEMRLADEAGRPVPPGTPGELLIGGVPGQTLAAGYLNQPEATEATFGGGWLRTGDVVRLDDDGFYHFVDRTKDMIKRSGENIAAGEIERVVNDHQSVLECAAIGVPDPVRDEAVVVYAVARPGHRLDEHLLLDWCRARLTDFKVPSTIVLVDALPQTSVGKIRKDMLRRAGTLWHPSR